MTITIDDGTFEVGNSFVTILEADTYAVDRGYTTWAAATEALKEMALIRTFDYLSVQNWKTTAFTTEIPVKVKNAQCLGAIKELAESGALQPDVTTGIKSESIDGVLETEYFESTGTGIVYSAVENLISPYINKVGFKTRLVRGGGER